MPEKNEMLKNIDIEIAVIESKIMELNKELKILKTQRDKVERPIALRKKIKKYEKMYPEAVKQNLESLVKINESFEAWHSRFGQYRNGSKSDPVWSKEQYDNFGYTNNNYIKWLVEANDPRVSNTEVYKQAKND